MVCLCFLNPLYVVLVFSQYLSCLLGGLRAQDPEETDEEEACHNGLTSASSIHNFCHLALYVQLILGTEYPRLSSCLRVLALALSNTYDDLSRCARG